MREGLWMQACGEGARMHCLTRDSRAVHSLFGIGRNV